MSRSQKMLDMLIEEEKEPKRSPSFSNKQNNCMKNGVDPDVDNSTIPQHSPLPAGAEEISQHLGDIWNEMNTAPNPSTDETIYNLQPSIVSLGASSSFDNSPLIQLEDLVNSDHRSTPVDKELSVSTPMPSPTISNFSCDSVFSPNHADSFISSSSFSTQNSPATPHSPDYANTPKTTRKRQRRQNEWIDLKRKCLKNLGKRYITKRGKIVDEKTMGPSCKCRYNCTNKITLQQRLDCFAGFWKLGDRTKQWDFIIKYSDKMNKKRCLNQEIPNKRKYTFKYYLPLIADTCESQCEKTEVCQTMFINTLAVSTRIIKTAWMKYDGSANIEGDRRGRHDSHKVVINDAMKQSVCDHVRAFVPVESHYIRKSSQKLYLQGDLSIAKMFKMYNEWFDSEKYTSKATKERQYRDIINSNFNLAFHVPKKDQCDECHVFRSKKEPSDQEKESFEKHQSNKKVARQLKGQDKECAEESNGATVAAVFDFEKVLLCPQGNISILYYKRKLSSFNFTVFNMAKRKAICYMWDESIAKRGANEVSSCLLDFIQTNVEQGAEDFRFWSDNCAGQNRNRFVFSMYLYAAKKFNIRITHRFLQKGHTQNEGDSVHSVIERASKTKIIYTPQEWRALVRWAKNEGESYVVRNVTQNDIFDFKRLVNNKVWMKDIGAKKIAWSNIREVHADGSDPNKLFFKYDLTQPDHNILLIRGNTRNSVQAEQTELKHAYSEPIPIPAAKYKDLMDMCRSEIIPIDYHQYFTSLPHHITVDVSEESDSELSQ